MIQEKAHDKSSGRATEETVQFIADARLISVLGEQLIGSEKVGILELIKNAYDAGASRCTVTLEGVPGPALASRSLADYADLPGPIIVVADDGSGMDREDLVQGWLRPATSRRARIKDRLRQEREAADKRGALQAYDALVDELREAHGGRLPLGEKGIGRLATHRLGRYLWLRTKTRDDPMEWELRIDWAKFDSFASGPLNLDAVELTLRHQPATAEYGAGGSGTVICCYGGRTGYEWTHDQIVDVGRAVNSLRSPRTAPQGFEPRFHSPEVGDAELASPLERVPAPFDLLAVIEENGKADIEIRFAPPPGLEGLGESFKFEDKLDLRTVELKRWQLNGTKLRRPECGPFLLHVRAWLRDRNWLGADFPSVTAHLNRYGGITIFRDGLATLPAEQSAKVDWLDLQQSQIKKSANISYYQLAGEIELQQQHTLALRDRSSREGMIQTRAYSDLALLTRAAVDQLQFQIKRVRTGWKKASAERVPLRTIASAAKAAASVGKILAETYDFRKDPLNLAEAVGGARPAERIAQAADTLVTLGEQLKIHEDEREGLMEAAGFGLAIGVAVHELGKLASAIVADVSQLRQTVRPSTPVAVTKTLESLEHRSEALLGEVKRVAPLRVTRSDSLRAFSMRGAAEAARSAFIRTLDEGKIQLHIDREDFRVKGRFGAIAQVFANLIDNAVYWIGTQGQGGAIQIAISTKGRTVLVSDTGPGISKKMGEHLFQPFYSDKSPPSGLGLYICRYYLGQCGASIRLARASERSNLPGAQFLLDFSKSPTAES